MHDTHKGGFGWTRIALYALVVGLVLIKTSGSSHTKDVVSYVFFTAALIASVVFAICSLISRIESNVLGHANAVTLRARAILWLYCGTAALLIGTVLNGLAILSYFGRITGNIHAWLELSVSSSALGFFVMWLNVFQVRLSPTTIEYWSFFGGHRSLTKDHIKNACIQTGVVKYIDRFRPPMRLEIISSCSHEKPIIINLKMFSRSDLDRTFDWLGQKLDDAFRKRSNRGHVG